MNSIKLIRNKWFLLTFSLFYLGIIWTSFQWVYHKELLLQHIYKGNNPPDTGQVVKLYSTMMKSVPKSNEFNSFYCLAKILARAEKRKESIKVLNRMIKIAPEDGEERLWLAIELYNQKKYREAEKHFVMLLRKNRENPCYRPEDDRSRVRPIHQSIKDVKNNARISQGKNRRRCVFLYHQYPSSSADPAG